MERECFEDQEAAQLLNTHFIAIKVDKEERPDIDGLYMQVCQSVTGSGGWPLTILMTPTQKPFFAGTYLPKNSRRGMYGLMELLSAVWLQWSEDASSLTRSAAQITRQVKLLAEKTLQTQKKNTVLTDTDTFIEKAFHTFEDTYDPSNGGFGHAPKFPCPHNLMFLIRYHAAVQNPAALSMAEKTLMQMYKGGIFDHIGYGFSRYSTDERWLAPHFEKMLYDNALMIMAYAYAYQATQKEHYKMIALKTFQYVLHELTAPDGGFYCAQDADSSGQEGLFYIFTPHEIIECLGREDGLRFCEYFDITERGNFEGKNIPNRLYQQQPDDRMETLLPRIYQYRQTRAVLHKDDKILASWNGLMIAALAIAYRILEDSAFLDAAKRALYFLEHHLMESDNVFASWRDHRRSEQGFIDDYAFVIWAYMEMHQATRDTLYQQKAKKLCQRAIESFFDFDNGGFFMNGNESEALIFRLKETYDGAVPSGNAVMAYNLFRLSMLSAEADEEIQTVTEKHTQFMNQNTSDYPAGHCFYGLALLWKSHPPTHIVCVLSPGDVAADIHEKLPKDAVITVLPSGTSGYPLLNGMTTYYVCHVHQCSPPRNQL